MLKEETSFLEDDICSRFRGFRMTCDGSLDDALELLDNYAILAHLLLYQNDFLLTAYDEVSTRIQRTFSLSDLNVGVLANYAINPDSNTSIEIDEGRSESRDRNAILTNSASG